MKKSTLAVALVLAVTLVTSVSSMALAYGGQNYVSQGTYQQLNQADRITETQAREIAVNYLVDQSLSYNLTEESFETRRAFVYKLENEGELQGSLRVNAYDSSVTLNECDEECTATCDGVPSQFGTFNRKGQANLAQDRAGTQMQRRGNMGAGRGRMNNQCNLTNQPS